MRIRVAPRLLHTSELQPLNTARFQFSTRPSAKPTLEPSAPLFNTTRACVEKFGTQKISGSVDNPVSQLNIKMPHSAVHLLKLWVAAAFYPAE